MTANPTVYKGNDATILIKANGEDMTHTTLAISDFSITLDKGTVEQELVGEAGNFFIAGSLSIEGSLTSCKVHAGAIGNIVSDMIDGTTVTVSGSCGPNSLNFYFVSAQVTGFDFSIGSADDIVEGSIDFSLLKPYLVSSVGYTRGNRIFLSDQPLTNPI